MTDTITSTLDILAIACIERPNDFAAWAALCDYCEENGLNAHPRALAWVLQNRGHLDPGDSRETVDGLTEALAYGCRRSKEVDHNFVYVAYNGWALPLMSGR